MAARVISARGRAYLLLAGVIIIWGSHWSVAKIGLQTLPPFTYATLRLLAGMAVLAALMQSRGRLRAPPRGDIPIIVSYGLLAVAMGIAMMNLAVPFVGAGRASILAYTLPLWVVPIMALVWRARPSRAELAGLALGMVGLGLLLNPAAIDWTSPNVLLGCALLLLAAMAGAAALVHVRAHPWQGTPFDVQIWQLLVALVPMILLAILLELDEWAAIDWDLGTVFVVLYSGPLATAFAFWASQSVVRAIGPLGTSISYLAVPVVGIVTGVILLGEQVGVLDLFGLVVTSAGIVVVLRAQRGAPQAEREPGPVERTRAAGPAEVAKSAVAAGLSRASGQYQAADQSGAVGQYQAAGLSGAAGQYQAADQSGAVGQSGAIGQSGASERTEVAVLEASLPDGADLPVQTRPQR